MLYDLKHTYKDEKNRFVKVLRDPKIVHDYSHCDCRSTQLYVNWSNVSQVPHLIKASTGPQQYYNGIQNCFTYDPPGPSAPGIQDDKAVCVVGIHFHFMLLILPSLSS